jgi:hypothetical protein
MTVLRSCVYPCTHNVKFNNDACCIVPQFVLPCCPTSHNPCLPLLYFYPSNYRVFLLSRSWSLGSGPHCYRTGTNYAASFTRPVALLKKKHPVFQSLLCGKKYIYSCYQPCHLVKTWFIQLTRLIAREDFINFSRRGNFSSVALKPKGYHN